MSEKLIIFSAPSGSGKTTIVRHLMEQMPQLAFSISATSRPPRGTEQEGADYYFLDVDTFRERINLGHFLEWEEVYPGTYYGTLKSEVERIYQEGKVAVFDVDVVGGLNIKKQYTDRALAVFIQPPSVKALRERLQNRATDTPEVIAKRLAKAEEELSFAPQFDTIIINDVLEQACQAARQVVKRFITQP
jgi:guanylate kinase